MENQGKMNKWTIDYAQKPLNTNKLTTSKIRK